ncbi:hypothetical protein DXC92_24625 [Clostridiales bacterium TF09-2AC]|nr:hypothetical protein DXC92_24625 [Clostridiales bacterium TF09-2AC]
MVKGQGRCLFCVAVTRAAPLLAREIAGHWSVPAEVKVVPWNIRPLPGRTAIWARGLFIFQDKTSTIKEVWKGKGEKSYEGTGENL